MQKGLLGILVGLTFAGAASADEWVVEAHFTDQAALQRAASHFEHVIVDRKRNTLRVDTNAAGIAALQREGLAIQIDVAASARVQALAAQVDAAAAHGNGIDSIPGFECYRTVEETYATLGTLASDPRDIARLDDIGPSWKRAHDSSEGYEMQAIDITNFATLASDPDRPQFAGYFSIHAREYAPAEIGTRFAEWLVNNYGTDPEATWLVDHNEFHIVTPANPDGRKQAEQQIYWRKNDDQIDGNCDANPNVDTDGDGIDLNRNFPFHWNFGNGGSSGSVCDETYRGPLAASEQETHNLFQYVAGTCTPDGACSGGIFADHRNGSMEPPGHIDDGDAAPDDTRGFFLDMHSNAALVLWPWGDTSTDSPNVNGLTTLGRRIAWFNSYTPKQSNELYLTDGTTDDSMYGLLGVASYTIETGAEFFEDCNSFEGFTSPHNLEALRYIARSLHAPYQLPAGPDTVDVSVSSDLVVIGDVVTVTAHLDSQRFNQSNGSQTIYDIAGAKISVGDLPWNVVVTQPMDPADGAFDSPVETATATFPIGGGDGRLFLFVQGTDTNDQAGTPNGAYVDIAFGGDVGTVFGAVTDHTSGDPLGAEITLHNPDNGETHHASSDPETGNYRGHGYPGTYDVTASAPHHIAQTVTGVSMVPGIDQPRDFSLLSDCVFFDDDVENGSALWTSQAPWTIVSNVPGNATHVWNTPNYQDGIDRSLTTADSYDLTGYSGATLDFDDRCDTESGYDFGYVEFSTDGGSAWTQLYSCSGQSGWQSHHLVLPSSADNASAVKVRFRLHSDEFQNAPGWAVDNIRFAAGGDACIAQQTNDEIFVDGFDP
jgi:hypothetical protein